MTEQTAPPALRDPWCAYPVVGEGGWIVAYIEANQPGYYATTYTGDEDYVRGVAKSINESKGLTSEQVLGIAHSSIAYPGAHYDGPAGGVYNPFEPGDMAESVMKDLDAREVASVEGDSIRLRIGDSVTEPLPAANYRKVGGP